jgi:hypothetical protein
MARGILGEYGSDTPQPQAGPVHCGGVLPGETKDVMNYKPPQGPKGIMDPKSPGLHGRNAGNINSSDSGGSHSGSPDLGGTNHGCCGSQGKY